MHENHQTEQYFWAPPTVAAMAELVGSYQRPCCLCTPMVGRFLHQAGRTVSVLDIDERFAALPGFMRFDLFRPHHVGERFDFVLCDPPFFRVKLSTLFHAIRGLVHFDLRTPIAIAWPTRRERALLSTFAPFGLQPTGIALDYVTVRRSAKTDIRLYGNYSPSSS